MALFKSKFRNLKFYVGGELYAFSSGSFSTDDPHVIAAAEKLADVKRVDQKKAEEPAKQADVAVKPKAEEAPEKSEKPATKRKANANASAK